eukprot:CAMPEP_0115155092 /NCGR_PEP_ID=MMETSP0227-20121206/67691_1 /TAXON_ID=89957 /ORGANISM="Polarella glacialis, Strain CCMP 1383" /LENGTH=66 /DNA_ID=CAMNT_0002566107 /DNA_START=84 /DNA_END=281 /DNA_ORIENTATION=-
MTKKSMSSNFVSPAPLMSRPNATLSTVDSIVGLPSNVLTFDGRTTWAPAAGQCEGSKPKRSWGRDA